MSKGYLPSLTVRLPTRIVNRASLLVNKELVSDNDSRALLSRRARQNRWKREGKLERLLGSPGKSHGEN